MGLERFVGAVIAVVVGLFVAYAFCRAITAMMGEAAVSIGLPRFVGEWGWHYIPALAPAWWASTYVGSGELRVATMLVGTALVGTLFALVC